MLKCGLPILAAGYCTIWYHNARSTCNPSGFTHTSLCLWVSHPSCVCIFCHTHNSFSQDSLPSSTPHSSFISFSLQYFLLSHLSSSHSWYHHCVTWQLFLMYYYQQQHTLPHNHCVQQWLRFLHHQQWQTIRLFFFGTASSGSFPFTSSPSSPYLTYPPCHQLWNLNFPLPLLLPPPLYLCG